MLNKYLQLNPFLVICFGILLSVILHWRVFSLDLISIHVWRQTQTQSTIESFAFEDFNILNPKRNDRGNGNGIFRMEFPLMQWLFAIPYKIVGKHLIISRICTFLLSVFSVLGLYFLIKSIYGSVIGIITAWLFLFSPSFFYYSVNPLPDNLALLFAIWGLVFFQRKEKHYLIYSSIFFGLSTLVKLPFVVFYGAIVVDVWRTKKIKHFIPVVFSLLPSVIWYLSVIPTWQTGIVGGMLQDKSNFITFFNNIWKVTISVLPELLIGYSSVLFFVVGLFLVVKNIKKIQFSYIFTSIGLVAYYLFEANQIGSIHDYYLFPFLPFLFIIIAKGIQYFLSKNNLFKYLVPLCFLLIPVTTQLRMKSRWNPQSPGFNKNLLIHKNSLQQIVDKNELCIVGNDESHFIWFYYLNKKGWAFSNDELTPKKMQEMISLGAKYLYSDSRIVEEKVQNLIAKKIGTYGSINVYKLKR